MRASKAVAYELTKIVPIEVLETYKEYDDHANDLRKVGGVLIETHLPGWLYYAINEADDHEVTNLDTKLVDYIDEETIISVAEKYADKPESGVINLNRPGERDWMQEDPMEPYRNSFQERYDGAVSAIDTVLEEVLADEFDAYANDDYRHTVATNIVETLDMFTWELYRMETPEESNPDRRVAEWIVDSLPPREFGESYMDTAEVEVPEDSSEQYLLVKELREKFTPCLEEADLHQYDGRIPSRGLLPKDEERRQKRMQEARENLSDF